MWKRVVSWWNMGPCTKSRPSPLLKRKRIGSSCDEEDEAGRTSDAPSDERAPLRGCIVRKRKETLQEYRSRIERRVSSDPMHIPDFEYVAPEHREARAGVLRISEYKQ